MSDWYEDLSKEERGALLSEYGNPNNLPWHMLWAEIEASETAQDEDDMTYFQKRAMRDEFMADADRDMRLGI